MKLQHLKISNHSANCAHRNLPLTVLFFVLFFTHLSSFHFDASMWWRHSMTALTFPIRLAQCVFGLLISNNAMATVVASVFLGLPLPPTVCLIFLTACHTQLFSPPFLHLYLTQIGFTVVVSNSSVKGCWTVASLHVLLWLFASLKTKWNGTAEYELTSFKIGAAVTPKTLKLLNLNRKERPKFQLVTNKYLCQHFLNAIL